MAAAAPIDPAELEIGSRDLFFDRKDVAELVDDLWDRVHLLEGDKKLYPGIDCVLYANSHTPGSQVIYVETELSTVALVGDMVRKVDLNVKKAVPPGLFYDLEAMRRALVDIDERADVIYPPTTQPSATTPDASLPAEAPPARLARRDSGDPESATRGAFAPP